MDQTGLLLLSPRLATELWRMGKKEREKEKEKGEGARGLTSSLRRLPGKEAGGWWGGWSSERPWPGSSSTGGGEGGMAVLLCRGVSPRRR